MLSILIPIYEFNSCNLVKKLHKQCLRSKVEFEILCFDDNSTNKVKSQNRSIGFMIGVNYVELSENKGRAKIRNLLAKSARYENLLFLDCDSKIDNNHFIKSYLSQIEKYDVISGGRKYSNKPPRTVSKYLHWKYGTHRESRSLRYRSKNPYSLFHSNNFLIKRDLILHIQFDADIRGYGYEDLVLAHALKKAGIEIKHIDNPVVHSQLYKTEQFLIHTHQSIENLHSLYSKKKIIETKLTSAFNLIERFKLKSTIERVYTKFELQINKNLRSKDPSLLFLDLYKLYHFIQLKKE